MFARRIHWLRRGAPTRTSGADATNVRRIREFFPLRASGAREQALSRGALDAVNARVYITGTVIQAEKHAF